MGTATPTAEAYFTTSYVFSSGTTSTITLEVWQAMSEHLALHHRPMTGAELMEQTGLTAEQLETMFRQFYYQRYYGFRRFDSLVEWEDWAREHELLYDPELHDQPEEAAGPVPDAEELPDEDESPEA